jgi:hypothetical protein
LTTLTATPEPASSSASDCAAMMSAALRTAPVMLPVMSAFWPLRPTIRP